MKMFMVIVAALIFTGCSGDGDKSESKDHPPSQPAPQIPSEVYSGEYTFPSLNPGDGVRVVSGILSKCKDKSGVQVDNTKCSGLTPPTQQLISPAGVVSLVITNGVGDINVSLGETLDKNNLTAGQRAQITCNPGYDKVAASCLSPNYQVSGTTTFEALNACEGIKNQTSSTTPTCVNINTGATVSNDNCSSYPSLTREAHSPAGQAFEDLVSILDSSVVMGDKVTTCSEGETANEAIARSPSSVEVVCGTGFAKHSTLKCRYKFEVVSAGEVFACGVAGGRAFCWGNGFSGSLGNGDTQNSNTPVEVKTSGVLSGKHISALDVGKNHACVIASGDVYCWGAGGGGKLGDGLSTNSSEPVAVDKTGALSGKVVTSISAGEDSTCAVAGGQAFCWGGNSYGQLGVGDTSSRSTPTAVDTSGVLNGKTVSSISTSTRSTCLIASGEAYCFGAGNNGALGTGLTSPSNFPVAVLTSGVLNGVTLNDISVGGLTACALGQNTIYCWGAGSAGQMGNGAINATNPPTQVDMTGALSGKTISSITSGTSNICALAESQVYCWGAVGMYLGNLDGASNRMPAIVSAGGVLTSKSVAVIGGGYTHACAVADGSIYCWGDGALGKLGDGSATSSSVPLEVANPPQIVSQ